MPEDCKFILEPFAATAQHLGLGLQEGSIYGQSREKVLMPDGTCKRLLGRPVFDAAGNLIAMTCCCGNGTVAKASPFFDVDTGDTLWLGSCAPDTCCECRVLVGTFPCETTLNVSVPDCDENTEQGPGIPPLCYPRITDTLQQINVTFPRSIICGGTSYFFDHVIQETCGVVQVTRNRQHSIVVNQCENREPCEISVLGVYVPNDDDDPDNDPEPGDRLVCWGVCGTGGNASFTVENFGPPSPGSNPNARTDCQDCHTSASEQFEDFFAGFTAAGTRNLDNINECAWFANGTEFTGDCTWGHSPTGGIVDDTLISQAWAFAVRLSIRYVHLGVTRINVRVDGNIGPSFGTTEIECVGTTGHVNKGGIENLPEVSATFGSPAGACFFAKAYASRLYSLNFLQGGEETRLDLKVDLT